MAARGDATATLITAATSAGPVAASHVESPLMTSMSHHMCLTILTNMLLLLLTGLPRWMGSAPRRRSSIRRALYRAPPGRPPSPLELCILLT